MGLARSRAGDIFVLALSGRLDSKTSHELEAAIHEALAAGERRFVVDLAELEYLSSAGLRVLLILARKMSGAGRLALCSLSEPIRAVFDVSGFLSVFTVCDARAEALAAVAAESGGVLEKAASALGVGRDTTHPDPRPLAGDPDLAARAARLLGVNVSEPRSAATRK